MLLEVLDGALDHGAAKGATAVEFDVLTLPAMGAHGLDSFFLSSFLLRHDSLQSSVRSYSSAEKRLLQLEGDIKSECTSTSDDEGQCNSEY